MNGRGSLFGGVIQLVFTGSLEAVLDSRVRPESLHGRHEGGREWVGVLVSGGHLEYDHGITLGGGEREGEREGERGRAVNEFSFDSFSTKINFLN